MTTEYAHMLLSLFGVIALLLAFFVLAKKLKLANTGGTKQIKIRNAVSIGAKEKILLVEVNKTVLLIGATPSHIETLYVFNDGEAGLAALPASRTTFAEQVTSLTQVENNKATV